MIDYIKKNKEKIAATAAKAVAALIIPGGLLVWGAYELGRYKQRRTNDKTDIQKDTQTYSKSK